MIGKATHMEKMYVTIMVCSFKKKAKKLEFLKSPRDDQNNIKAHSHGLTLTSDD